MATGIRTALIASYQTGEMFFTIARGSPVRRMANLGAILRYAMAGYHGTKRRTPMNVDTMVERWVTTIAGMCTAHSKDEYDAHDAKADELLGPILTAPIKQLREFYAKLLEKMRNDQRIPFLVLMGFEAWGEVTVKNAPDEAVIRDQIPKAIERALRWRDPEVLAEVKERLEQGEKPKLRGRQSCLFLEMGRGKRKISVMV